MRLPSTEVLSMIALRHRDDPLHSLPALSPLDVTVEHDAAALASVMAKPVEQIGARFAAGHHAYVARIAGEAAAFGWVATSEARVGELDATLRLPHGHRYLWNFVTLPAFRGRGVYPRLLQAILRAETASAEWTWIMYAPENHASARGIAKAGFTPVGQVSFDEWERPAYRPLLTGVSPMLERLLGIPRAEGAVTPCWKCVRAGRGAMACADGACHCDYQRPTVLCHPTEGQQAA